MKPTPSASAFVAPVLSSASYYAARGGSHTCSFLRKEFVEPAHVRRRRALLLHAEPDGHPTHDTIPSSFQESTECSGTWIDSKDQMESVESGQEWQSAGGGPPSDGGSNDFFSGDRWDGDGENERKLNSFMSERNIKMEDIDGDVVRAFKEGIIGAEAVYNYLVGAENPAGRLFLALGGENVRGRFLADSGFLAKIGIEQALGVCGKMSAEFTIRRDRILKEIDFVMSDLVTALMADFVLVYFPAASLPLTRQASSAGTGGLVNRLVKNLPTNVFQTNRPYTLAQRVQSFFFKSSQLATVGVFCALTGFALTNFSILLRERFIDGYVYKNERTNPFKVSMVYGLFVGTSSNARYQIIGGLENSLFPIIFRGMPFGVSRLATTVLRFFNTYVGASHWIFFVRSFGMMRSSDF